MLSMPEMMGDAELLHGDVREVLSDYPVGSVQCVVTSPPYWGLRDYGVEGQLGLEPTVQDYISTMVRVFRDVRHALRDDGTLWLNLGDCYNAYNGNAGPSSGFSAGAACDTERPKLKSGYGLRDKTFKPKDLLGVPWRVAFALQEDGWYLRQDIIWHKPNPMPESVTDRCTKAHEYLFLLTKSERYYFDNAAMQEPATGGAPGNKRHKYTDAYEASASEEHRTKANLLNVGARGTRNRRSVWTVTTKPYKGAHFATFPPALIEPCILAGSRSGDLVMDPFNGSGTTGAVALQHGRRYVGIELNEKYIDLTRERLNALTGV